MDFLEIIPLGSPVLHREVILPVLSHYSFFEVEGRQKMLPLGKVHQFEGKR